MEKIQGYMAKSVTEAVSGEYGRGIGVWKEFLGAEYTEEANPGEFLEQEPDPTDKTLYVILFMVWMEEKKGSSEEQRGRALTYLRHHIDTVGLRPTEFMDCEQGKEVGYPHHGRSPGAHSGEGGQGDSAVDPRDGEPHPSAQLEWRGLGDGSREG